MSTPASPKTTNRLPDALAFVKPNRAQFWVTLRDCSEPHTVSELTARTDHSDATVRRMLHDLDDWGLVAESTRVAVGSTPVSEYHAIEPLGGEPDV